MTDEASVFFGAEDDDELSVLLVFVLPSEPDGLEGFDTLVGFTGLAALAAPEAVLLLLAEEIDTIWIAVSRTGTAASATVPAGFGSAAAQAGRTFFAS